MYVVGKNLEQQKRTEGSRISFKRGLKSARMGFKEQRERKYQPKKGKRDLTSSWEKKEEKPTRGPWNAGAGD